MSFLKASSSFHAWGSVTSFQAESSKPGALGARWVADEELPAGVEVVLHPPTRGRVVREDHGRGAE